MMAKKRFEEIDTSKFSATRENPFTKKQVDSTYKTIRIYEEDYKQLKRLAYFSDMKIVEMVQKAVAVLIAQEKEQEEKEQNAQEKE
ncbi:hypothetical protein [Bacillus sp. 37MA]|uniref:hypothetical protein n=1 Tax=Bacillus sp. 37MA TaxID=1132442 RepID=UPI0003A29237|nr:hypothetical protein [Bacillus sp. 37MA]